MKTWPNIFFPYESYVPLNWDFSNLDEVIETYISKEKKFTKFNSFAELLKIFLKYKYILRAAPLFHISTKSPNYCQYAHK